jgi:hypothetical protein
MAGLTYDTGALVAAERNDRAIWALHRRALERGIRPVVPVGVLAQAWRGGPQHQLSRMLRGCRIEDLDEVRSRAAGTACALSNTSDVIDAAVVVGAVARADVVVTGDTTDLARIAAALQSTVAFHPV